MWNYFINCLKNLQASDKSGVVISWMFVTQVSLLYVSLKKSCLPIFNETDIRKCLQSLNSSPCLGSDKNLNFVFKKCADFLCYSFTSSSNRPFSSNLIPKTCRSVKTNPIPKKVSGHKNVKFRPWSITLTFFKKKGWYFHFNLHLKSIYSYPTSYKCKRRTLDAAVVLHHNIASNWEKCKIHVWCVFLNYTSAFDSVLRKLIDKLMSDNTGGWINKQIFSHLYGREQYTVFAGKCSTSQLFRKGEPQGAILSLLLKNFPAWSTENTSVKHADNLTVCILFSASLHTIEMNEVLSCTEWCSLVMV